MHAPWDFLHTDSVTAEPGPVDPGAMAIPLESLGVLRIAGDDASDFLQGQLTQSVAGLEPSRSVLAGWCSAKGRLLALFRVVPEGDGFLLLTPRVLVEDVVRRLRLFVLRARVTIEDASDSLGLLGLVLPETATAIHAVDLPRMANEVIGDDPRVVRLPGPGRRFLALADSARLESLWRTLAESVAPAGEPAWRLLDIRAGLPEIVPETREQFVPQMLNLEPLQAISYAKGCYPGQEVVARMHYLGRLKRRMFRFRVEGEFAPGPGALLRDHDGREQGQVVSSAPDGAGAVEILAVVRAPTGGRGLVLDDRPLEPLELPYTTPATAAKDSESVSR